MRAKGIGIHVVLGTRTKIMSKEDKGNAKTTWYAQMSNGLKAFYAERDAEREFMELLEKAAPEIRRLMMIELLSAPALPSPTAPSSLERH
jgi:hypothetical protein